MIPRLHKRTHTPHDPLTDALGRRFTPNKSLTAHTVVAHWPGLAYSLQDDEQKPRTLFQWVEHLEDPYLDHPFAASGNNDRRAILHLDARLHPDDRELTAPEWTEAAHRLARAVGVEIPGKDHGCRWIAIQAQPKRLDLIANLIHLNGAWHTPPTDVLPRLSEESRRIEQDLRLTPAHSAPRPQPVAQPVPTTSTQLAATILQIANEQTGPLATVRGLVEHTAHRIARQPGATATDTAHRLELIARRLHGVQQDLDITAARLDTAAQPRVLTTPPATRRTTHRPR